MSKRVYTEEQMARRKERSKQYYQENKESIKAKVKEYASSHKEESIQRLRRWKEAHPERVKEHKEREYKKYLSNEERRLVHNLDKLNHYHAVRALIFERLGKACVRCQFDDLRALQIDHIQGGGGQQRKRKTSLSYFLEILNDPDLTTKYQTLCANCNWIKRHENNENSRNRKSSEIETQEM